MTWQVGDLALCVDDALRPYTVPGQVPPQAGRIYRVRAINTSPRGMFLCLGGLPSVPANVARGIGWHVTRFRKIEPDKHEDCEPEFVKLLKRSKVSA